jgi:hypothetical protein
MQNTRNKQERYSTMRHRRFKQMIKLFGLIVASQSIYFIAFYSMRKQQGKQND